MYTYLRRSSSQFCSASLPLQAQVCKVQRRSQGLQVLWSIRKDRPSCTFGLSRKVFSPCICVQGGFQSSCCGSFLPRWILGLLGFTCAHRGELAPTEVQACERSRGILLRWSSCHVTLISNRSSRNIWVFLLDVDPVLRLLAFSCDGPYQEDEDVGSSGFTFFMFGPLVLEPRHLKPQHPHPRRLRAAAPGTLEAGCLLFG